MTFATDSLLHRAFPALLGLALLAQAPEAHAQALAVKPLPAPHFSIDAISPTAAGPIDPDDVLDKPGPAITFPGANLGLNRPGDDVTGLSLNRSDVVPGQTFMILFGVDRATTGAADPDPALVADNRPYNVKHQATRGQAAGDLFMALDPFTRAGPLLARLRVPVRMNNTLVINQADMGGGDFDLLPVAPALLYTPPVIDETDDTAYDPGSPPLLRSRPAPSPGHYDSDLDPAAPDDQAGISLPVFFTLRPGSTSLGFLPGTNSAADVYVDTNPGAPGGELQYAAASYLLLQTSDAIDAILVFDNGNNQFDLPGPAGDQIIFSLARNSPSLAFFGLSAGDLLVCQGRFAPPNIFARASDLGLDPATDNVDGVELLPTSDPNATIHDRALFLVIPGDYNGDYVMDATDCGAFPLCYSGPGVSYDTDGAALHVVSVGPGDIFNSAFLMIEPGDTVRWVWNGGVHNVVSGPPGIPNGYFNSGPPTGTIGNTFNVLFNEAFLNIHPAYQGLYPYFSQQPPTNTMTGTVQVKADPCATFDMDFDGDVDCADWPRFKQIYAQFNPEVPCPLLTIPEFVAALLVQPLLPAHVCMADMNGDGKTDGKDTQPYVTALLGGS